MAFRAEQCVPATAQDPLSPRPRRADRSFILPILSQILSILKQGEAGTPVPELCREHGMSSATYYKWRAKFGGMDASMMSRLKELEEENRRLKKMYAEERLKAEIHQEALEGKW